MDIKLAAFKLDDIRAYFSQNYRNTDRFCSICCQKASYNIEADALFYEILRVKNLSICKVMQLQ